jgi:hypothetical protein
MLFFIRYLAKHMDKALEVQREISSGPFARIGEFFGKFCYVIYGRKHGNFLLVVYLFTKCLFIGNVVCQLFLLNKFLGNKYNLYGLELLMNVLNANFNMAGSSLHNHFGGGGAGVGGVGGAGGASGAAGGVAGAGLGAAGVTGGLPASAAGGGGLLGGLNSNFIAANGGIINTSPAQMYTEVVESPRFPRVTMCHFQVQPSFHFIKFFHLN